MSNSSPSIEHHHLIVSALVQKPMMEPEQGVAWIKRMISHIEMDLLAEPTARYCTLEGNKGLTVTAIITTSHIALHLWDEPIPAELQLDIYSCRSYDKRDVFADIKKTFRPISMSYKHIDRRTGLIPYNEENV